MSSSTHKASEDGSSHETLSHGSGPVVLPNCLPLYDILYDMQSHLLAGDRSSHVGEKILDRDYSPMFLRKGRFPPALRVASRKHHFDVPQIRTGLGESGCLKGCFRHGGSLRRERDVNAVVVGEEFHGDGGRGKGAEKDHHSPRSYCTTPLIFVSSLSRSRTAVEPIPRPAPTFGFSPNNPSLRAPAARWKSMGQRERDTSSLVKSGRHIDPSFSSVFGCSMSVHSYLHHDC